MGWWALSRRVAPVMPGGRGTSRSAAAARGCASTRRWRSGSSRRLGTSALPVAAEGPSPSTPRRSPSSSMNEAPAAPPVTHARRALLRGWCATQQLAPLLHARRRRAFLRATRRRASRPCTSCARPRATRASPPPRPARGGRKRRDGARKRPAVLRRGRPGLRGRRALAGGGVGFPVDLAHTTSRARRASQTIGRVSGAAPWHRRATPSPRSLEPQRIS